jgi:RimJ/RimL family protein N-acetyltransferase
MFWSTEPTWISGLVRTTQGDGRLPRRRSDSEIGARQRAQVATKPCFGSGLTPRVPSVGISSDLTLVSADTATELRAVTDREAEVMTRLRPQPTSLIDDFSAPNPATGQDRLLPRPDRFEQILVFDGGREAIAIAQWHPVRHGPTRGSVAFNIGIALHPDARGRGHGSRAQALLAQHLFDRFPAHRSEAGTDVDNIAGQRALERAGRTPA